MCYSYIQRGQTRGRYDFIILRDKEQANRPFNVNYLIHKLQGQSLYGHLYEESLLPGINKISHFQYAVLDSDFIICIIDGEDICEQYNTKIISCHKFKVLQSIDDHIIHVFTDREQECAITTPHPNLRKCVTLYEAVHMNEDNWMERIIQRMTTPSLGEPPQVWQVNPLPVKWIKHRNKQCSRRKGHIDPMLDQCWANVVDGGPTLVQHWIDELFLLESNTSISSSDFKGAVWILILINMLKSKFGWRDERNLGYENH